MRCPICQKIFANKKHALHAHIRQAHKDMPEDERAKMLQLGMDLNPLCGLERFRGRWYRHDKPARTPTWKIFGA